MNRRRLLVIGGGLVAVVVAFVAITSVTGLAAPGPLRRYPTATLDRLAAAIHADAGDLRTPDDCWETITAEGPTPPRRAIANVDHLRSRVVVLVRSDEAGRLSTRTLNAVDEHLDTVLASDASFSRDMIVIERSPQGWSPLMSCALVVRGWGGA